MKSQESKVMQAALRLGAVSALTLLATGCASTPAPNAEFADTKGVTSAAEASGAQDIPEASLYLKMSKDGLALAEEQIAKGENQEAVETLHQAKADARLAISLTSNAQVEQQAIAAIKQVEDLQSQSSVPN